MSSRVALVACLTMTVSACATLPMTVITKTGREFRGTVVGGYPSTYKISDGRISCTGSLALSEANRDSTLPIACDHGVSGIVIYNGSGGVLRLSDGTDGTFILGGNAAGR